MQTNELVNLNYVVNGDTTAASVTGPWIRCANFTSVGFMVEASVALTAVFSGEVTNVDNPTVIAPPAAQIVPCDSPASFTAKQPSAAPVSALFEYQPAPTAQGMRVKCVRSAGGAVGNLQIQSFARGI